MRSARRPPCLRCRSSGEGAGCAAYNLSSHLPMCSPISGGSAATVLATREGLREFGIDESRAIRVLSCVAQTGSDREPGAVERHITALSAKRAYDKAGIGPEDVSVAEVHDATAMGEIIQMENLGFCAFGEGGRTPSEAIRGLAAASRSTLREGSNRRASGRRDRARPSLRTRRSASRRSRSSAGRGRPDRARREPRRAARDRGSGRLRDHLGEALICGARHLSQKGKVRSRRAARTG